MTITVEPIENDVRITFGSELPMELYFSRRKLEPKEVVQFKGLLHCKPINELEEKVLLDDVGILSLMYQDGRIDLVVVYDTTVLTLPIGKELYSHLERLSDLYL